MTLLQTSFEGGANGVTVATSTNGGDSFNGGTDGTGATFVYSTFGAADGALCARITTGTTAATSYRQWNLVTGTLSLRMYVYLNALPAATLDLAQIITTTGGTVTQARLRITTAGKLALVNGSSVVSTGTATIPTGQWVRIEATFNFAAGTCNADFYLGHATTSQGTSSATGVAFAVTSIEAVRLGVVPSSVASLDFYTDAWALSDSGRVGPVGVRKVATTTGTTTGGLTITVPAGVTTSHFAVVLTATSDTYATAPTISLPGFTTRVSNPSQANNSGVHVLTRLGGMVAGNTLTFTTSNTNSFAWYVVWYDTQGRDVAIVGTVGGRSGTSATTVVIPALTTTVANQDVLVLSTERTTADGTAISTWAPQAPAQDFFLEEPTDTDTSGFFGHFTQGTAGSTGTRTVTYSGGSGNGAGLMLALAAAPPPATAPTVSAGIDGTIAIGATFNQTGSETSDGGATVTSRAWTIVSGPTGAGTTLATAAALSWTPTQTGSYVLRYAATNSAGTGTDDLTLVVLPLVGSLTDDFSTGLDGAKWGRSDTGLISFVRSRVEIQNGAQYLYPAAYSLGYYSLIGSAVFAQMHPAVKGTGAGGAGSNDSIISLQTTDGANRLEWVVSSGNLVWRTVSAGSTSPTSLGVYDPTVHGSLFRIRESGGTVYFESSLNGNPGTWTSWGTVSTATWMSQALRFYLMAGHWDVESGTDTAYFDSVNVLPPLPSAAITGSVVGETTLSVTWSLTDATSVRGLISASSDLSSPLYGNALVLDPTSTFTYEVSGLPNTSTFYVAIEADGLLLTTGRGSYTTLTPPPPPPPPEVIHYLEGSVLDRWDGTQLVRQQVDRWTGTEPVTTFMGDVPAIEPVPYPSDDLYPSDALYPSGD